MDTFSTGSDSGSPNLVFCENLVICMYTISHVGMIINKPGSQELVVKYRSTYITLSKGQSHEIPYFGVGVNRSRPRGRAACFKIVQKVLRLYSTLILLM